MKYKSYNFIITNYHVIPMKIKSIEIELSNKKIIKLSLRKRFIHKIKPPKDLMIIRIKPNEFEDIQCLDYDLNYIRGYDQYLKKEVFSVGYPNSKMSTGSGKITKINECEFCHNIPTEPGSSGSPIILFNSLVIGIPKEDDHFRKLNMGTFIGEIFKEIHNIGINEKEKEEKKKLIMIKMEILIMKSLII